MAEKPPKTPEFKRFEDLTRKLIAVPKADIDAARKATKAKEARKPKPAAGA